MRRWLFSWREFLPEKQGAQPQPEAEFSLLSLIERVLSLEREEELEPVGADR